MLCTLCTGCAILPVPVTDIKTGALNTPCAGPVAFNRMYYNTDKRSKFQQIFIERRIFSRTTRRS